MSYGHQGTPRRPGYGAPGQGRPAAPGRRPAYHETRALPMPPREAPPNRRPPGRYDGQPPDDYGPSYGEGYPPSHPRRLRKRRRPGRTIGIILLILLVILGGTYFWLDTSLNRVAALADYPGRPAEAAGTNWLIVGSDSREGLTPEEKKKLVTGDAGGQRTDTMLVAHLPDNDTPATLVSLPRDSNVEIPGHGVSKINAAFALGGPKLLVQTVEQATGLRIDHYAEINFAGFANMVDAVGGVEIDVPKTIHDNATGVTIKAGKQVLDGPKALAFVRTRKSAATPRSDLDRVANQRKFIGALAAEISSPATFLNPFDVIPLLTELPDALTVDDGDHLHNLAGLGFAMGGIGDGGTVTTTVPVTDGSATQWDENKSQQLFEALKNDSAIPKDAIYD
ncbi:MAG TPA: LCP family protein [Actinophytocola sp.]|uniref:LCP family protein n=1 Tax=Actinophytocola sp. TaxID=1872138 RepID=UPI002F93DB20